MDEIDIMAATQHQAAGLLTVRRARVQKRNEIVLTFLEIFGYKFMMKFETPDEIVAKMLMFAE